MLIACLAAPAASAATPANRAAAEGLFDEARRLLKEGRAADACPKLEESQRLDPGVGTLLYLGECYARLGRTASAWATYRDAESAATAAGQDDRARLAKERAAALFDKLPRVVVDVPVAVDLPGLQVIRDGERVGRASFGTAVPIDPGAHVVEARADGHEPFRATVTAVEGQIVTVTVPALRARADAGVAAAVATAPAERPPARGASPWVVGLAAGGGAAVVVGSYFGLSARAAWKRSRSGCDATNACDPAALDDVEHAGSQARLATVFFGAGAVLGGAALTLHLTRRRDLALVAHPGVVALSGAFP